MRQRSMPARAAIIQLVLAAVAGLMITATAAAKPIRPSAKTLAIWLAPRCCCNCYAVRPTL